MPRAVTTPNYYTRRTLALRLGLSVETVARRLPEWQRQGMPCALPWRKHGQRWNITAIEQWIDRRERHVGAVPPATIPSLTLITGDRA